MAFFRLRLDFEASFWSRVKIRGQMRSKDSRVLCGRWERSGNVAFAYCSRQRSYYAICTNDSRCLSFGINTCQSDLALAPIGVLCRRQRHDERRRGHRTGAGFQSGRRQYGDHQRFGAATSARRRRRRRRTAGPIGRDHGRQPQDRRRRGRRATVQKVRLVWSLISRL